MSQPGRVVRIRVNPQDCMACVDIVRQAGYQYVGMSFAQVVSLALGVVVESLRQNEIVPVRDGFEYGDLMSVFKDIPKQDRALKIKMTKAVRFAQVSSLGNVQRRIPTVEEDRKRVRWRELAFRNENSPENMDSEEIKEMHALALELNPE